VDIGEGYGPDIVHAPRGVVGRGPGG